MDSVDTSALINAIDRLNRTAEKLDTKASNSVSYGNIHFDTGGMAIWISFTLTCVLAAVNIMQLANITKLESKYERMQDYLNAIYAQAPHLKPKDK